MARRFSALTVCLFCSAGVSAATDNVDGAGECAAAKDNMDGASECAATATRESMAETEVEHEEEGIGELMRMELLQGGLRMRATGNASVNATGRQSFALAMALIARAVYNLPFVGKNVDGWNLAKEWAVPNGRIGTDKVSIYRKGSKCALAISGSDDLLDLVQDFHFLQHDACGVKVHAGFYSAMIRLTENQRWSVYKQYLMGSSCSDGRYLVGHGMGGAIVSVLAGCLTHVPALKGLQLTGLYTFGAPGISKPAMSNSGKCFPGSRFYNMDLAGGDPVPWVTSIIGLRHPKMQAVRLRDWFGKSKEISACGAEHTTHLPEGVFLARPLKHAMGHYIGRIGDLY